MEGFDEIGSPEFYDCFSSPKPLITPSKLFLGDCADEKAIDWTILENCNPNLVDTPMSVRSTDSKRFRKSLIPVFSSPTNSERQPSGILSASGNRGSKSRRISKETVTDTLASRVSSGRKSVIDKDAVLKELNQQQALEILELKEKITALELQNKTQETNISELQDRLSQQNLQNAELQEELTAVRFFAQVQGQKIEEQENLMMTFKMDHQEQLSTKNRKYKSMIKKLQSDRASYESGAATIIQQLNDQMAQLQKFAMTRIETLEKQILETRRTAEDLQKENADLKTLLAEQEKLLLQHHQHNHNHPSQQSQSHQQSPAAASARGRSLSPLGGMSRVHVSHVTTVQHHHHPTTSTTSSTSSTASAVSLQKPHLSSSSATKSKPAVRNIDNEEDEGDDAEDDEDDECNHVATPPMVNNKRRPAQEVKDILSVSSPVLALTHEDDE